MPVSDPGRKTLLAGIALVAMLAVFWIADNQSLEVTQSTRNASFAEQAQSEAQASDIHPQDTSPSTTPLSNARPATADHPAPDPAVASWVGAEWDGSIQFDANGQLIFNAGLRQRFDFVLTGLGEQPLSTLRQLLIEQLRGAFDRTQIQQVLAEFDLYSAFLQAADELMVTTGPDLADRFDAITQLQQALLGTQRAQAWFGDENADIARALAIQSGEFAAGDTDRDPRAGDLAAATRHQMVVEMNAQYDALAIEPSRRFAEREALYGSEAAQRLAALDQDRAAWRTRLDAYVRYRDALNAQHQMSPAERDQALADWRSGSFTENEIRRVLAMEQAGLLPPNP